MTGRKKGAEPEKKTNGPRSSAYAIVDEGMLKEAGARLAAAPGGGKVVRGSGKVGTIGRRVFAQLACGICAGRAFIAAFFFRPFPRLVTLRAGVCLIDSWVAFNAFSMSASSTTR